MEISFVGNEYIEDLSVLFDQYRVFYKQPSDLAAAKKYLEERFHNKDSVIIAAIENSEIIGFTQLYPSFSSVAMSRIWILNDLFVKEGYRRKGVAKLLIKAAEKYALETGAVRIVLATQISNVSAQLVYESLKYTKDEAFYHYTLKLR